MKSKEKADLIAEIVRTTTATTEEAARAADLFIELAPALRLDREGRFPLASGNKSLLGMYRTVEQIVKGEW